MTVFAAVRRTRRPVLVAVLAGLVVLAVAATLLVRALTGPDWDGVDHRFVIPDGTGAFLDGGGRADILPRELEVRVGDRIVVENLDDRGHDVGPWTVRAESVFTYRFTRVGRFDSACGLHTSGRFFIDVLPEV